LKCLAGALGLIAAAACASGPGQSFSLAKGQGDRAYSSGRYEEAAAAYDDAGKKATRPHDRAEALYLAGSSYARARSWDRARDVFRRLIAEIPASDRARRASFDLADLEMDAGQVDRGFDQLRDAMMRHPNDGLAHRALERWVARLDQNGGDALAWLNEVRGKLEKTELDETVRYQLAAHLEPKDPAAAREAFVACAERHPYPGGSLFDDALFHASLLDEKLGRPAQAIEDLRRMLAAREPSTFAGSYERPRFSPAQFRIAVLYRDKIGDHAAARKEFHKLYADHATSILRDDALWEEAKLARDDGDTKAACALVGTLTKEFKDSRYAACTTSLCPEAAASARPCHPYLLRPAAPEGDAE
jgi:tetratricopeptide (TPR) repeat protein